MTRSRRALSTLLTLGIVSLLLSTGCKKEEKTLRGSGVGSKVTRSVPSFTRITVGGSIRAEVEVASATSVELLGDDNLLERVVTRVDGDTLVLEPDRALATTQPLVARIRTPSLDAISLRAAASAVVAGVRGDRFSVAAAGGTRLTLRGSSRTLDVSARGAAQLELAELAASLGRVNVSGGSRVELGHLERLEVTQSGPSVVIYRGEPELEQKVDAPARLVRAR